MVDLSCNPALILGNCEKFAESFRRMENRIPEGTKGNPVVKTSYPYATSALSLPRIPYEPKTVSLNRIPWEGWRYGANYMNSDDIEKPYGYPDYYYYRHNYCGPCCSCVKSIAPLAGDPNGKNPNIRYVQLDYKNLLGSGFASQGPPTSQMSPYMMGGAPGAATSCGRNHCPDCSGVYKKKEQPVKFQVCIGDPTQPETVQPCPPQPMKIYLPLSMMPRGEDETKDCDDEKAEDTNEDCPKNKETLLTSTAKQQFEVQIPGLEQAYNGGPAQCVSLGGGGDASNSCGNNGGGSGKTKKCFEPCGCCKACKNPVTCVGPKYPVDLTRCQLKRPLPSKKPN